MIAIEWRYGLRVRHNPTCEILVELRGFGGVRDKPCGKPATERVSNLPHWSVMQCHEHAAWHAALVQELREDAA